MSQNLVHDSRMLTAQENQAKALMRIAEVLEDISDAVREINDRQKDGRPGEGRHPFAD